MGDQTILLVALLTLTLVHVSECGDTGCRKFRNLDNGQTFFRYGGLMVIFRCHPGYKLHGHKANSCVSGHWSRDLPVCVGSGCSHPGSILHGTSRMNKDGSWADFSCNSGFRLHGPLMIYCKEADIMSSASVNSLRNLKPLLNLQISADFNNPHFNFNAVDNRDSKKANLRLSRLLNAPFHMFKSDRNNVTKPRPDLTKRTQFSSDVTETTQGTREFGSMTQTRNSAVNLDKATQMLFSEDHFSSTVSSGLQTEHHLVSFDKRLSVTPTPAGPTFPHVNAAFIDELQYLSTSSSLASSPATSSSRPSSTRSTISGDITLPSNISTSIDLRSVWKELHKLTLNSTSKPALNLRTICPYPPVPLHGTFYFHNLENPGPTEFKYYIKYTCYTGYTLAHGDVNSYCQPGGTWSGITPVCLELTPCSINNGGCSQLCSDSSSYKQNSETQTRTWCHCRPGFALLDDGQTCGDVDECLLPDVVTGCMFSCVNTPGSFHCSCPDGFSQMSTDGHCQDIDECAVNDGLGPCMQRCHNLPRSYRCSCSDGYILAGDGHSCFAECPGGYRKKPLSPSANSTEQNSKQECVDINECLENPCEWQCINLPGSHRCICPRGYTLQRNGRHCKDINECNKKNGGCSHLCVNRRGGYKCACPASHRMSSYSWKRCLPKTTASSAG